MSVNFIVGLSIAIILLLLLWSLKGLLLTPISMGKNTDMQVLIRVSGHEPQLEQTLKSLIWLHENGTLKADVQLVTDSTDEITSHIVQTYAQKYSYITLS